MERMTWEIFGKILAIIDLGLWASFITWRILKKGDE
jgi:hypothetical protein